MASFVAEVGRYRTWEYEQTDISDKLGNAEGLWKKLTGSEDERRRCFVDVPLSGPPYWGVCFRWKRRRRWEMFMFILDGSNYAC